MIRDDGHDCDSHRMSDLDIDGQLLQNLCQPVSAPDVTHAVMGRLGYMNVKPNVARRHQVRRWVNRTGTVAVMAIAAVLALRLHESSSQIRRAESLTIPGAVGEDFQRNQHQLREMIQTIRNFAPRLPEGQHPSENVVPEDVNRSAAAIQRWV
jgi:hypothetical protein